MGTPADTGSSRKYVAAVLGGQPADYWRLADIGTSTAVNQVKGGTATYSNVTQGVNGGPFADAKVDGFNGSSSYLALPNGLIGAGNQSVSLWFKTTATDGVLLSSSVDPGHECGHDQHVHAEPVHRRRRLPAGRVQRPEHADGVRRAGQ